MQPRKTLDDVIALYQTYPEYFLRTITPETILSDEEKEIYREFAQQCNQIVSDYLGESVGIHNQANDPEGTGVRAMTTYLDRQISKGLAVTSNLLGPSDEEQSSQFVYTLENAFYKNLGRKENKKLMEDFFKAIDEASMDNGKRLEKFFTNVRNKPLLDLVKKHFVTLEKLAKAYYEKHYPEKFKLFQAENLRSLEKVKNKLPITIEVALGVLPAKTQQTLIKKIGLALDKIETNILFDIQPEFDNTVNFLLALFSSVSKKLTRTVDDFFKDYELPSDLYKFQITDQLDELAVKIIEEFMGNVDFSKGPTKDFEDSIAEKIKAMLNSHVFKNIPNLEAYKLKPAQQNIKPSAYPGHFGSAATGSPKYTKYINQLPKNDRLEISDLINADANLKEFFEKLTAKKPKSYLAHELDAQIALFLNACKSKTQYADKISNLYDKFKNQPVASQHFTSDELSRIGACVDKLLQPNPEQSKQPNVNRIK